VNWLGRNIVFFSIQILIAESRARSIAGPGLQTETPHRAAFRVRGHFDIYNVFNANSIQILNTRYGAMWLNASSILAERLIKVGVQLDF
jgi:hypothetical protein